MTSLTSTHKRSMIFPGFFLACYEEKILLPRMPGHRRLGKVNFESFTFLYFQNLFIKKSYVFEWPVSWTLKQEHKIGIIFLQHIVRKKLTETSARSGSTPQIPCEHHRQPPGTPLPAPVLIHLGRRPRHVSHHPLASSICMRGAFVVD